MTQISAAEQLLIDALGGTMEVRLKDKTWEEARKRLIRLRQDCYRERKKVLYRNRDIYPEEHPDYNRTPYDGIEILLKEDTSGPYLLFTNTEDKLKELIITRKENIDAETLGPDEEGN